MKRLFLIFSLGLCSIGTLMIGISLYHLIHVPTTQAVARLEPTTSEVLAVPNETQESVYVQDVVEITDARPQLLRQFIARHNPKLLEEEPDFPEKLVEIADEYNLDYRLLPAISMNESNLCKVIPENSHNCLGLGVHSRGTWRFPSYSENFATAAKILRNNYIDKGLITPELIMTKYTPHSPNGAWAKAVNQFMNEIRYNDRVKGRTTEHENFAVRDIPEGWIQEETAQETLE